jgi:hypothetical protein
MKKTKENNLETKAEKIKSIIVGRDPCMKVYYISEQIKDDMGVSKELNGEPTHLAWIYPDKNKILVRRDEYKLFFENLKKKYKKKFGEELEVGEWKGFSVGLD